MATLGWAIFGCKRQRVLNVGNVLLIHCELLALRFIANEDRGPVRRLHAEYLVKIRFVRREDHIELWILQIHPEEVAFVIVINKEGIGTLAQELGEGFVVTERGRFAQRFCNRLEKGPEDLVVRPSYQRVTATFDDRVWAVKFFFLVRMLFNVLFDLVACETLRIQTPTGRWGFGTGERTVLVEQV